MAVNQAINDNQPTPASPAASSAILRSSVSAVGSASAAIGSEFHYTKLTIGEWHNLMRSIPPEIEPGDQFSGWLTHYKSPHEFYLHFDSDAISSLAFEVTLTCSKLSKTNITLSNEEVAVGGLCCAKWYDHAWYRAQIMAVTNDKCEVYFIDYGNTDWIVRKDILPLVNELRHQRIQAVYCVLNGYDVENRTHAEVPHKLNNLLNNAESITAKVIEQKHMGQFDVVPRFDVDIIITNEEYEEGADALKLSETPVYQSYI
jgi:hypothetical protein